METTPPISGSLRDKLEGIAKLEEAHSFLGVRCTLKDDARNAPPKTEEVIDYVRNILDETIELSKIKHDLPVAQEYVPS